VAKTFLPDPPDRVLRIAGGNQGKLSIVGRGALSVAVLPADAPVLRDQRFDFGEPCVGKEAKDAATAPDFHVTRTDRKSTRLNSSHSQISYAVFCLKKKKKR